MGFIKEVFVQNFTDHPNGCFVAVPEAIETMMSQYMMAAMGDEIVKKIAEKYVEVYGDEILKRIQEKTIEQKVIQKVIENLRNEIKKGTT